LKILIIALSGIGDALLFTPAASLIRKNFPDAKMDALVMFKGAQEIYQQSGLFDNIVYHDFLNAPLTKSLALLFRLRKKYDASINVYPANRREYNVIQFLVGANRRGGIKYLRRDLLELGFLNNVTIIENDSLHNVQENIRLTEQVLNFSAKEEPDLVLPLTENDQAYSKNFLNGAGIEETDTAIGFHAGSAVFKNQIKRRWEPEKFAELAGRLTENANTHVLIFGGPEETELKKTIQQASKSSRVLIPTSNTIVESAALLKRCSVFVTNDSGMMHIAASTKTPTVAIIGPTNTNYIHPWHTEYEIASLFLECSPCFIYSPRPLKCFRKDVKFKCVKELTVEMVFQRVIHLLSRN
jgi:lipopolysaccharide heptosyltransferase II